MPHDELDNVYLSIDGLSRSLCQSMMMPVGGQDTLEAVTLEWANDFLGYEQSQGEFRMESRSDIASKTRSTSFTHSRLSSNSLAAAQTHFDRL